MTIDLQSLVAAAGGEIVGKVRLQKVVYLLEQMGLKGGFSFEYRHYGPFSEELADQLEDDVVFRRLTAETRRRQSDGVPYAVFKASSGPIGNLEFEGLTTDRVVSALGLMQQCSSTILELAATINWLSEFEGFSDWRNELTSRKGAKAQSGRDEEALELLRVLGLPPAA